MIGSELKKRIFSSFFIISILSISLFYLNGLLILPFFLMIGSTVLFEFLVIDEKISLRLTIAKLLLVIFTLYSLYYIKAPSSLFLFFGLVFYFFILSLLVFYPMKLKKYKSTLMIIILPLSFWGITWMYYYTQHHGVFYYLSFQIIASLPDILGYFCGKKFPIITIGIPSSPHKTLGGFIGALILAPFCYQFLRSYLPLQDYSLTLICFLTFGAIWGDLLFSGLKRLYNLKDFSAAIPGHGGVLDRIDSLIGVIFFYQIAQCFL